MLRHALIAASRNATLQRAATELPAARALALRFVAGETLDEVIAVVRRLNADGRSATLDHLGESVHDREVAIASCEMVLAALDRIEAEQLDCGVSVKPSQLGIDVDAELCHRLVARICERAEAVGQHVTIDMEGSDHTQPTIDLLRRLLAEGHGNVGCAVQSYLHRTLDDVRDLTARGASLRLCKGAYAEPAEIAYQHRHEVDASYRQCALAVLDSGTYGRFATHDHQLVARIRNEAVRRERPRDRYEFQMLYGVREPLQRELVAKGERLRVYVPFGEAWYPYLVRRLAERPANLVFFLRALAGSLRD